MKHLYILISILFITQTTSAQTPGIWTSKGSNITASERSIIGISMVDSNTVWSIAYYIPFDQAAREFTLTKDGGETWYSSEIDAENGEDFFSTTIYAQNDSTAWVAMTDAPEQRKSRIYKTTDSGTTWQQQTGSFIKEGRAVVGIHFFDEQEGFAYGSPGTGDAVFDSLHIWTTQDGGENWQEVENNALPPRLLGEGIWLPYSNNLFEVKGDNIWFATRSGRVWKSTDRGATWEAFLLEENTTFSNESFSIAFEDENKGMAAGTAGIFRTKNGGENWERLPPFSPVFHYQIQHIPNTVNSYFLSYESSNLSFNNLQHAYTLDGGDTWIRLGNENQIEPFHFYSPTAAWGGAAIDSPSEGGMYHWQGNFVQDYLAQGTLEQSTPYTIMTPRQLPEDYGWNLKFQNIGQQSMDIASTIRFIDSGGINEFEETVEVLAGETARIPIVLPKEVGQYRCSVRSNSLQEGSNFSYAATKFLSIDESILAKDDGNGNSGQGFGFGNPAWYGYYGSAFNIKTDTLTAITIYIAPGSDFTAGSIQLTVSDFGEDGSHNQELFHSEEIFLRDYNINNSNQILTYELPEPLILQSGKYLFAAGQDTLQGIVGFNFDESNIQADGFWLVSPVAGGGYPWSNARNREVMMIRPHFKPSQFLTSTKKYLSLQKANIYPNPTSNHIKIEAQLLKKTTAIQLELIDITGKIVRQKQLADGTFIDETWSLEGLSSGFYWLKIQTADGFWVEKVLKQ
ncbi:MAG: T9SS type A sorting domain-containing protein [Bacteroidota bacterium]